MWKSVDVDQCHRQMSTFHSNIVMQKAVCNIFFSILQNCTRALLILCGSTMTCVSLGKMSKFVFTANGIFIVKKNFTKHVYKMVPNLKLWFSMLCEL